MRVFDDEQGRPWQAAAAFGSYGAIWLIFSRMDNDELRTSTMQAETLQKAEAELGNVTEATLRERLLRSEPWQ